MSSRASFTFCSGSIVMGSTIMPLSDFLTLSTSRVCLSMLMLRWMNPIPPSRAMQMAVWDSVTVSMAALTMGMFMMMLFVRLVLVSTSLGRIVDSAGTSSRSSKVKAIFISWSIMGSSGYRFYSGKGFAPRSCPGVSGCRDPGWYTARRSGAGNRNPRHRRSRKTLRSGSSSPAETGRHGRRI